MSWIWHLLCSCGCLRRKRTEVSCWSQQPWQDKRVIQCSFKKKPKPPTSPYFLLKIRQIPIRNCIYSSHKKNRDINWLYYPVYQGFRNKRSQPAFSKFALLLYYNLHPCLTWSATLCNLRLDKGHVWWPHAKDYVLLIWFSLRMKLSASGEGHIVGLS